MISSEMTMLSSKGHKEVSDERENDQFCGSCSKDMIYGEFGTDVLNEGKSIHPVESWWTCRRSTETILAACDGPSLKRLSNVY